MDIDFSTDPSISLSAQVATHTAASPLGLIVPGGPVRTDFQQTDATKWTLQLRAPGDLPVPLSLVSDVCCFLLPTTTTTIIPPTHGLLLYWQVTTSTTSSGFSLLGSLTYDCPSGIFRTTWSECNDINTTTNSNNSITVVTLGISMEPLQNIQNIANPKEQWESRLFMAQKIGTDLYQYMQSFDTSRQQGQMVVPTTIFERWMTRFTSRLRRDPNFFMKNQE